MDTPLTRIPHTFETFETKGGARIFRIPINAFPGFWCYAYLVLLDEYVVLIDAGSGFGEANNNLEAGFELTSSALGRRIHIGDLTNIFITHGHIDHFGGLAYLHPRTNAKVFIHELDIGSLINYEERMTTTENRLKAYLVEAGVLHEKLRNVLELYRFYKLLFHSIPITMSHVNGEMKIGPFEMLHVPGHCPGHVVIRLHDVLFCGDHILDGISPHQWPERLTLYTGLDHYFNSLSKVIDWVEDTCLGLPGHNDSIRNIPSRVDEIRQLHRLRLTRSLAYLVEPHTVVELSQELFGKVNGYNILLAIEEAGAHMEYLHQRGLLRIINLGEMETYDGPIPIRYQRSDSPTIEPIIESVISGHHTM